MGGGGRSELHHSIVTNFPSSPSQHRPSPETATLLQRTAWIGNRPVLARRWDLDKFLHLSGPSSSVKSGVWARCAKGPSSSVLLTTMDGAFQLSSTSGVHCTLLMSYGFSSIAPFSLS